VREALKAAEAAAAEKEELVKQVEQMEERISSLTVEAATSAQLRSEKDGFATQITTLEARIAQMSGAEADLRVQLDAARSAQDSASSKLVIKLEESTKAHAELAAQLATINEAKDMLETTAAAYTKSIEQLEGRIANLETTEADLQRQLDIAHKQRADSELAGSRQTEQLEQARTASDEQAATLRELTAKLQEAEERLASAASGSAEMEALEADKKSLQSEIDDTRARLADAETSIADLSNRLEESQRMSSELQAARHVLAGDLEAARMHASRLEEERADMVPSNDLVNV
jgi:chromosome segregation ATPase